jgi:hypothetical protein
MKLPNFYILGAQKAGTTWLAAMLRQHPQIYIPGRKELHFFEHEDRYALGIRWYARQFNAPAAARAVGEATPNYLAVNARKGRHVIERLQSLTPDARFIVTLRDPVSRALSAMLHAARKHRISPWTNFDDALQRMLDHCGDPSDVLPIGLYDLQLTAFFQRFPRSRFHVLIYEDDIVRRKPETLRALCRFLEVAPHADFKHRDALFNAGIRTRIGLLLAHYLPLKGGVALGRLAERTGIVPSIKLSAQTIAALRSFYEPTRRYVEDLIGRDLASSWGTPAVAPAPIGSSCIPNAAATRYLRAESESGQSTSAG